MLNSLNLPQSRFLSWSRENPDAMAAILCAILVSFGWLALHFNWVGLALLILPAAYVIGGYESAREGLTTLFEEKELDVDLLMIVAAVGAAGLGLWQREYHLIIDGAILILIFAISGALESYAMRRTERSIRSLMSLTTDTARVLQKGGEVEVAIAKLEIGDRILVKPGELIPVDAVIIEGYSTINQAAITGESIPVDKTIGDEVFAGTLNGNGALKLRLEQPPESSLIQRVIRLVEQAQTETPLSQQFIEKIERGYAKVVVVVGILLAVLPPFLGDWNWETTIYRALIFLVVASPCALMAAIMPTLLSGISNGARQGILFKNGAQLELIGRVKAIAFDKTGTLTTGQPEVYKIIAVSGKSETEVLQVAAALESYSEHPIGQAICRFAAEKMTIPTITEVQAHPGQGIAGKLNSQSIVVGHFNFIQSLIPDFNHELLQQARDFQQTGKTVVWVVCDRQVVGLIVIADRVRANAVSAIASLKKLGIEHLIMLTGDNKETAESVAQAVGISEVKAELLPEDKLHLIRQLQKQYGVVAMVGDGINDAPALAQATVGIAMGAVGSDVALETADIVLMTDRLEKIATAVELGRRSQTIVKQNIIFALSFIVLLLIANFAGNITLPIGVIGHEGSTVLVTLSGLRLLRG
ncbi:heavy metal translocating P-type ATPase [Phormidium sp. LEGE 05292]|uniref:heavy metal translocating P-type ATPase n=1 Tax=[Phormidium] sp. LEGE 05292 TaxID=767427 RepID=UPI001881B232|nr:heavy metal translocating P-type ATPase [Phormidium sp. LEGE 05292]MBE9224616.1 heavy metal translocating P-type ATPase [Phormidium sp. LEGE 05292]